MVVRWPVVSGGNKWFLGGKKRMERSGNEWFAERAMDNDKYLRVPSSLASVT